MLEVDETGVVSGSVSNWVLLVSMFEAPLIPDEAAALFETTPVPPVFGVVNPSLVTITWRPIVGSNPDAIGCAVTVDVRELTAPELEFAVTVMAAKFGREVTTFVEDAKICVVPAMGLPLLSTSWMMIWVSAYERDGAAIQAMTASTHAGIQRVFRRNMTGKLLDSVRQCSFISPTGCWSQTISSESSNESQSENGAGHPGG
jgi:hypothetical protein